MIRSFKFDTFFITTVGLSSTFLAVLLYYILGAPPVSPFAWLLLVVGVDVAHVYSTTFRTYLNPQKNPQLKKYLILVPLICLFVAFGLALVSTSLFWSVLVYIAVFHFARQQIGFLRIFTAPEKRKSLIHRMNEFFIYTWTLGSVLIWHLQGHKAFNWFTANDFYYLQKMSAAIPFLDLFIVCSFLIAIALNAYHLRRLQISAQVFFILGSTFVSWYFPIVFFNSDFIFTVANVLAHGIPYMALVWAFEKKRGSLFTRLEFFFPFLLLAAFLEEALWDGFIWREHRLFFESFYFLPKLQDHGLGLSFVLALLICPQLTHYLLDGFIWKRKYKDLQS